MSVQSRPMLGTTAKALVVPVMLRLLSIAFIASCLQHWGAFMGMPSVVPFQDMPIHAQVATIAFAVIKPFVAVGLWLLSSWGVILWVLIAVAEIGLHAVYGPVFFDPLAVTVFHGVTMALYLIAAWLTAEPATDT